MDTVKVILKYFIYSILFLIFLSPIVFIIFPIGSVQPPTIADKNQINNSVFQNESGTISFLMDRETGYGIIKNDKNEKIPVCIYLDEDSIQVYEAYASASEICQGDYIETWKVKYSLEELKVTIPKDSILGSKMKFNLYRFADLSRVEYTTNYARLCLILGDLYE